MDNVCNFKFSLQCSSCFLVLFWSPLQWFLVQFWWSLISYEGGAHWKTTFTVEETNIIGKFCLHDICRWQLSKWKFPSLLTCAKNLIFWGNQVGKASLEVSFSLQPLTLRFQETGISLENHWVSIMLTKVHYWAFLSLTRLQEEVLYILVLMVGIRDKLKVKEKTEWI